MNHHISNFKQGHFEAKIPTTGLVQKMGPAARSQFFGSRHPGSSQDAE
jgi:hypothetical protein